MSKRTYRFLVQCFALTSLVGLFSQGYALASGNLTQLWQYELKMPGFWVIDPSPAIFPDMAVFGTAEHFIEGASWGNGGRYLALDGAGNWLWDGATPDDLAQASPAIVNLDGEPGPEIVGASCSGQYVLAYNMMYDETAGKMVGKMLWSFGEYYEFKASPAVADLRTGLYYPGLEIIIANQAHSIPEGGEIFCISSNGNEIWKYSPPSQEVFTSSPVIADVDHDGEMEAIVIAEDGTIYCLNAAYGTIKWINEDVADYQGPSDFNLAGTMDGVYQATVISSPAVANLDDDNALEIVFGTGEGWLACFDGIYRPEGQGEWFFQTNGPIASSPAIGDTDGDGELEVVFGSADGYVYCLNRIGNEEWRAQINASVNGSPSLANLENNLEYGMEWPMFGANARRTGLYNDRCDDEYHYSYTIGCELTPAELNVFIGADDGYLYLLSGQDGEIIDRFDAGASDDPYAIVGVNCSPAIGDINGDAKLEVLFKNTDINIFALSVATADRTPPDITCPDDLIILGAEATQADYTVEVQDNVDPSPSLSYDPAWAVPGAEFPLGKTTVTVTAADAEGNSNSCSFHITVRPPNYIFNLTPQDSIQETIDISMDGDTIILAQGIYNQTIEIEEKAITIQSSDPADPNVVADTIIDGRKSGSVVSFSQISRPAMATLAGLTIQNGLAENGGGIYCYASSAQITNCRIRHNSASDSGGGIALLGDYAKITIHNSSISYNKAGTNARGGGIYSHGASCVYGKPQIEIADSLISHNFANSGGGLYCNDVRLTLEHSHIRENRARIAGGGIYTHSTSSVGSMPNKINYSYITANKAITGAGIYYSRHFSGSRTTIANSVLSHNLAYLSSEQGATLGSPSNPFYPKGGAIYSQNSRPTIYYCTVFANQVIADQETVTKEGGGMYFHGDNYQPTIKNSIFWDNSPNEFNEFAEDIGPIVEHSDIKLSDGQTYRGEGNINADPKLIHLGDGYYLSSDSPCIDSGSPLDQGDDLAGIVRPQGAGYDMGAIEYVAPGSCVPRAVVSADPKTGVDSLSVEFDATSSGGAGCDAVFTWDFGDGTSAEGALVSHTYGYGAYDISLTAATEQGSHTITMPGLIKVMSSVPTKEVGQGYEYGSIQQAINEAGYGEIIQVHSGTYYENINFLGKELTLISESGYNSTIIDGGSSGTVVTFNTSETDQTIMQGFTIQNGSEAGIRIDNGSSPRIVGCMITNNKNTISLYGGGMIIEGYSEPTINGCTISNNYASPINTTSSAAGGIYCRYSNPNFVDCLIESNGFLDDPTYSSGGGIFFYQSRPGLANCIISNNEAVKGGGLYFEYSSSLIKDCTIKNNTADQEGGGVRLSACFCNSPGITFVDTTFIENTATNGGGIYSSASDVFVQTCNFQSNTADYGGAVHVYMVNHKYGIEFDQCEFTGNIADDNGGAIYSNARYTMFPELTITSCRITGNQAYTTGAGISCNEYKLIARDSTIDNNQIEYGHAKGAGIYLTRASADIERCKIFNNTVNGYRAQGGGLYLDRCNEGQSLLANCLIYGNKAISDPPNPYYFTRTNRGGAIISRGSGLTIINSTIVDNYASDQGSGVGYIDSNNDENNIKDWLKIINSILWNDIEEEQTEIYLDEDNVNASVSVSYSDIQGGYDGTANIGQYPDFINAMDADYHLAENSACIDSGTNSYEGQTIPSLDLDNIARPQDGDIDGTFTTDMGAYEYATSYTYTMHLPAGWSMISLPLAVADPSPAKLFPQARVIYGFDRAGGYYRAAELNVGEGYWILLDQAADFTLTGSTISSYNKPASNGWYMIGGCSSPAQGSVVDGDIAVVYRYLAGSGYKRLLESERLQPGEGYWILVTDCGEAAELEVKP